MENSIFGINNTPGKLRGMSKGDPYVTYITGIGFIGYGEITMPYFISDRIIWEDKKYRHRFGISSMHSTGTVLPGAAIKDDLEFITEKDKWSVHLKGGLLRISLADFEKIKKSLKLSKTTYGEVEKREESDRYSTTEIGDELHDRIVRLFENSGFSIIENNKTKEGPDIIVEDPFTKSESRIIIQCKNTHTDSVDSFPSLKKTIDEYAYKRAKSGAAASIIVISGYKVPKQIDPVTTLENDRVAVWTDDVIDYYERLAAKISGFSKYQILGDLGIHAKFADDQIFDAIKIRQSKYVYYIISVNPEWLLKTTTVLRRVNYSGKIIGYQRLLDKKRITKDIPAYLAKDNWIFPNAIICTNKTKSVGLITFDNGKITLPSRYGLWWVIDGQHRLYSFTNSDRRIDPNSQLILTLIDSSSFGEDSEAEQAGIFVSLNQEAKKVQKKLLLELEDVMGIRSPHVQIVFGLAQKKLFINSISGHTQKEGNIGLVAFTVAVKQVVKRYKDQGLDDEKIIEKGIKDLNSYFVEVEKVFRDEWNDEKYILKSDRGINGLLALYLKILDKYKGEDPNVKIPVVLNALRESHMQFRNDLLVGRYLGAGGGKKFADEMALYITKIIPGFEPRVREEIIDRFKSPVGDIGGIEFIKKWLINMEGSIRIQQMHIDRTTFNILRSLDKSKIRDIRLFFGDIPTDEKADVIRELESLRRDGYDIIITRARKPYSEGGLFHTRWIGSEKYCIYTDADLKTNALKNGGIDIKITEWTSSPQLKEFDDFWSFAELNPKGVKLDYDWSGED